MSNTINKTLKSLKINKNLLDLNYTLIGWVKYVRSSSSGLAFCTINDGSTIDGLQIVISEQNIVETFFSLFRV